MDFWVTVGALAVPLSFWRRWGRSRSDEEAGAADPPMPTQLAMPHISGQEIKLGQLIGKGGMGSVHEAMWGGARVAVKVLHASPDEQMEALKNEAHLLASLRHPCICTFFGVTTLSGFGCTAIVMEMLEGGSLAQLLRWERAQPRQEKLAIGLLCRIGFEAASGIAYLHRCGYSHRDVKAANVLLDGLAHARVADFGIAQQSAQPEAIRAAANPANVDDAPLSENGLAVLGTFRYMAPEVRRLHGGAMYSSAYTASADTFSFGLMLWEMTHGEVAFGGTSGFDVASQLVRDGKRPEVFLSEDRACFGPLIRACWQQDALARPPMSSVADELGRCAETPPTFHPTPTPIDTAACLFLRPFATASPAVPSGCPEHASRPLPLARAAFFGQLSSTRSGKGACRARANGLATLMPTSPSSASSTRVERVESRRNMACHPTTPPAISSGRGGRRRRPRRRPRRRVCPPLPRSRGARSLGLWAAASAAAAARCSQVHWAQWLTHSAAPMWKRRSSGGLTTSSVPCCSAC
jgi:proto-oncogene serine/threonine-protein kinase mos